MTRRLRRTAAVIPIVVAVVLAVWHTTRPKPVAVAVAEVQQGRVEATVSNTRAGTVKACRRARMAPSQGGQVAELRVHKGDHVKAGEILLELWNDDLKAAVALAQSQAKVAAAQAVQSCTTAASSMREARRIEKLHHQGLASEDQADTATSAAQANAAACSAARANTQAARDRERLDQAQLARTILRAPFDGIVAETTGEVGEYVTPSPPGIPTPPAVDLVDNSCLYVSAPIDEVDAPRIRKGMPARILLDAFGNHAFAGHVRSIAPYVQDVEKQARTVEIEVQFDHPKEAENLMAGYSADAEVILSSRDHVLRIPTEALIENNHVLVFDPASHELQSRRVETGLSNWQYTEITGGLHAGEQVVTSVDREGVKAGVPAIIENTKAKP